MKSILFRLASAAALMFVGLQAHASYMIIPYKNVRLDPTVRTHFVISSKGNDLGFAPQLSGLTKAAKLSEVYTNDQVVLLFPEENDQNLRWLQRSGLTAARKVDALLDTKRLFEELSAYTQIVSIHTYGHSAIPEGVFLDAVGKKDIRWYPTLKGPEKLVGRFTSDAHVTLHGCNLGHSMAPMLSRLWKIPVAGALTGTNFEVLMPNGSFAPLGPEKGWAKTSLGVYREDGTCIRGCVRMRPGNGIYDGKYGKYRQGLPFYKFFCSGIPEEDCLKGMARSLVSSVTANAVPAVPSLEQYAQAAREWLCPVRDNPAYQKLCEAQLAAIQPSLVAGASAFRFFTPFPGASNQCNFASCYVKPQCLILSKTSDCAQQETPPARSTTFVDEYENYLKGFALLASGK